MNLPSRLTIAPLIIVLMIAAACSPRAHSDGHTAEADSVAYYDSVVSKTKDYFHAMQTDSFLACHRQLDRFMARHPQPQTLPLMRLQLELLQQKGVFEVKMKGQIDSGLVCYREAKSVIERMEAQAKGDDDLRQQLACQRIVLLSNMADAYKQRGCYDIAVEYFRNAISLDDSLGLDNGMRATLTIGIASAYAALGAFEQSAFWWEHAATLRPKMQRTELFEYLNNRGNDYYLQGCYRKSLDCFLELDSILSHEPQMQWERMFARANMSDLYIKLGQPDSARSLLVQTEPFFARERQIIALYYLTTQRIELALNEGRTDEATRLAHETDTLGRMIPEQVMLRQKVLLKLYEQRQDWQHYATTLTSHNALRDSITTSLNNMRLSEVYMHSQHERQLLLQEKMLEEKDLSIRWSLTLLGASVVIIVLIVAVSVLKERTRKLKEQAMNAQITALRMENVRNRITPHFLSNALSTEMLAQLKGQQVQLDTLVELLNRGIEMTGTEQTTLSEELEFITFYCYIEQRMLGHDLVFRQELAPEVRPENVNLPAMTIQILVENALKHGLIPMMQREGQELLVTVKARSQGNGTLVEVFDNGVGLAKHKTTTHGIGTKVLLQTIQLLNEQHAAKGGCERMEFGMENRTDGSCGCRSWLYLPDNFVYEIEKE